MQDNMTTPLEPDKFYHIFNRGNDGINVFYQEKNYRYFLIKYDQYLSDYVDTYAYCLLPNHFHLLLRIKSSDCIERRAIVDFPRQFTEGRYTESWAVSERFRRFFMAYAKAINQQEKRTGSLFQKYFRRLEVNSDQYFTSLVYYIHNNATHHGIHPNLATYPWSSYLRMIDPRPSKLMKEEVIAWFGGRKNYVDFHRQGATEGELIDSLTLE